MDSKLYIKMESDREELLKNKFDVWQVQTLYTKTSLSPENSL